MELRIKEECIDYSIGGGKMKIIRVFDIPKKDYSMYYKLFPSLFVKVEEKLETEDDKNKEGGDPINIPNTDGEDLN
jgi:hypothetical protein